MKNGGNHTKKVSIVVPCRNEEEYIGKVLDTIVAQDYPRELLEVLVVDGESEDGTAEIIREYAASHDFIHCFSNPDKVVPHALNLAIRKATGSIFLRMDAHASYPGNYVSALVAGLDEYQCDNTGGLWITEPGDGTLKARAIADATAHPFGIGNAHYRLDVRSPRKVDTVPYGCYRMEVFDRIGLFDEDLVRNQDDEFNGRLIRNGGTIFLLPDVRIRYFARRDFGKTALMFYQYGLYKPLVNKKLGSPATLRQFVPPLFTLFAFLFPLASFLEPAFWLVYLGIIGLYFLLDLITAVVQTVSRSRPAPLIPLLMVTFPLIHFSYGYGYLKGILRFIIMGRKTHHSQVKFNR